MMRHEPSERSMQTLKAILTCADPKTWVPQAPLVEHPWEKDGAVDLRDIDLSGQTIGEVGLEGCAFNGANFTNAVFEKTMLQGSIVSGATFRNAKMHLTQMLPLYGERVDFRGVRFDQAFMEYSKLLESDFSGAVFSDSSLNDADFSRSSFADVRADGCRFDWSLMRETDLTGARFSKCRFSKSVLQSALLSNATFEDCDLRGTDFRGSSLDGTKILGGQFGIYEQGSELTPTRFDDTPTARKLVAESGAEGIDTIEWHPVSDARDVRPERVMSGEPCVRAGYWFTPAGKNSRRYFKQGEVMPEFKTDYGSTIWQWAEDQSDPKL